MWCLNGRGKARTYEAAVCLLAAALDIPCLKPYASLQVLADKEKRQVYDQFGEEGLKGGVPSGGPGFGGAGGFPGASGFHFQASNPNDIFREVR